MSKAFDFAKSIEGSGSYDGLVIPTGSGTGQAGEFRFNSTTGKTEYWSSTSDTPQWRTITQGPLNLVAVHYLVIAGGGSGGGGRRRRRRLCLVVGLAVVEFES